MEVAFDTHTIGHARREEQRSAKKHRLFIPPPNLSFWFYIVASRQIPQLVKVEEESKCSHDG